MEQIRPDHLHTWYIYQNTVEVAPRPAGIKTRAQVIDINIKEVRGQDTRKCNLSNSMAGYDYVVGLLIGGFSLKEEILSINKVLPTSVNMIQEARVRRHLSQHVGCLEY